MGFFPLPPALVTSAFYANKRIVKSSKIIIYKEIPNFAHTLVLNDFGGS